MKDIMDEDKRLEEELKELRQVPIDENDRKKKKSRRSRKKTAKRRGFPFAAVFMALVVGVLAGLGADAWVRKGITLHNDKEYYEAEVCLNEAVRLSPEIGRAHV